MLIGSLSTPAAEKGRDAVWWQGCTQAMPLSCHGNLNAAQTSWWLMVQEKADECTKLVSELERVLPASALQQAHASRSSSGSKQATQMMETALLNMHDYFVHVAARVAALQEATEAAREAHLRSKRLVCHALMLM